MQMSDINVEETEQASPEEEAALEQAMDAAMQVIHGDGKTGDSIAEMVLNSQNVIEGIGQAAATVLLIVEWQQQMADDLKLALAEFVLDELVSLAIEAGALASDEVTDEVTDQLVSHAYSNYLSMQEATGQLDQANLQASVDDAKQLMPQGKKSQPQQRGLLQINQK